MSNPIPPFVCSTPPPIDCIVDAQPTVVDDFDDFAAVDDQFEASSLPVTPAHFPKLTDNNVSAAIQSSMAPSPDSELNFSPEDDNAGAPVDIKQYSSPYASGSSKLDLKNDLPYIIEANSPPPLDFDAVEDDITPCDDLDNDDDEADEFPVDDDVGKYDDNISLPSLKFDSLSNISKSTTPVSDELTKSHNEDSDSVSAFQQITSGNLDEEANASEIKESTQKTTAPVEEVDLNAFSLAEMTISKEPDDLVNQYVSQQSSSEQDDDFTEFGAFPADAYPQSVVVEEIIEPPADDLRTQELQAATNDFAFEADFSQFSSFEPISVPTPAAPEIVEKTQFTEKSSLDDLEADDFDDFQDFAEAVPVVEQRKLSLQDKPSGTTNNSDDVKDDEEDDFGEFSEVIESANSTSIPSSNSGFNLANLNDKLKPILEMMFPLTANAKIEEEQESTNHVKKSLSTSTMTTIDQIDTAKALEYQWSNSEVRHSLIKSLGVDSRNILYGEKWNSSMPRYAANLSFNPLEPMKPDKAAASGSSGSASSTIGYRKRSESLTTTSSINKADVPAVEFDWNSSGLVNPLDGVKEILHERTIEAIHTPQFGESHPPLDQQSNSTFNSNNNIDNSDKPPLRRFIDEETISATIEFKSNADASATISTATAATTATTPTVTPTAATLPDYYLNITSGEFLHHHPSVLETDIDTVIANTQAHNNTHAAKYQESYKTDLETELQLQHSGVVTTSTYAGPLKETHIFTPSKSEIIMARSNSKTTPRTSESKCPIDFDYEIAAAGIIIDETVVKKEYRDVEYNPGFGLKYREETEHNHCSLPDIERDSFSLNGPYSTRTHTVTEKPAHLDDFSDFVSVVSEIKINEKMTAAKANVPNGNSFDDEFSDFQSVPAPAPPTIVPSAIIPPSVAATESKSSPSQLRKLKESKRSSSSSRTGTPVSLSDEMILSPAILLPQAIQMESKPTIEWPEPGINAEEMARIEELFPQPKVGSNKSSPSHSGHNRSQQQSKSTIQLGTDDDDWSDFVSVPAVSNHIQSISQQFQKRQASPAKSVADPNDEEWSDFVSSAPPPSAHQLRQSMHPQFNSAAWQNANFYNNPMSAYALAPTSFYYQAPQPMQQQSLSNNLVPNLLNINNNTATNINNIINNNSINQYLITQQANHQSHHNHHQQQHIQMMRDFSSSSPMDGGSLSSQTPVPPSIHHQYAMQTASACGYKNNRGGSMPHHGKSSQFAGGSSKVAPTISLIPDLGFVAPTHTSFITVPKNTLITKK